MLRCSCFGPACIHGAAGSAPASQPPRCTWLQGRSFSRLPLRSLTQLMIDHDLGVTTQRTYAVKRIDSDFFGEE